MWKKLQRIEIDIEWYLMSYVCKVIKPTHMNLSCLKLYLDLIVFLYIIIYIMWKMCFLYLKPHKHIALHEIYKIMFF